MVVNNTGNNNIHPDPDVHVDVIIKRIYDNDIDFFEKYATTTKKKKHVMMNNINEKEPKNSFTPLVIAAKHGKVDIVKCLLKLGAQINQDVGTTLFSHIVTY